MSDILDTLRAIFKGSNPNASEDEINAQVKSYAEDPNLHDALKDLVPPAATPGTSTEPKEDVTATPTTSDFKLPPANSAQSSFDVNESTSPVTMKGVLPSTPTGNLTQANPNLPTSTPEMATLPPTAPMAPTVAPKVSPSATKGSQTPTEDVLHVGEAPLAENTSDDEKRKQMLADEAKRRNLGILPILAGGIGDAISTSATAFGAQAGAPATENIVKGLNTGAENRQKAFEDKMKNDPQSDISKAYRQMVLQIAPDLSKNASFTNMSAMAIGEKLPLIDTMMKAQAMKDNKAMQMEALKISRQNSADSKTLALSEKEDQFNQRRWERFGAAVNPMNAGSRKALGVAAINNMRADRLLTTASNKSLSSQDYSNLISDLQGIYKGGAPDQEMMKHGDYRSIQRDAAQLIGYFTSSPKAVMTPEIKDHLVRLTRELKDVDNKAINDNLGFNRVIFDELEKKDPEKFQRAMQSLESMTEAAHDTASGAKEPLGMPSAIPANTRGVPTQLTSEDQEAIDWAKNNPTDPRSAKILALHKV